MGAGTTSEADEDVKATRKTSSFLDRRKIATGFGISREALGKMIPWAQARLHITPPSRNSKGTRSCVTCHCTRELPRNSNGA